MREITEQALVKRINRALAEDSDRLRKTRGERARQDLGEYYITDRDNAIVEKNINLIEFARWLERVKDGER